MSKKIINDCIQTFESLKKEGFYKNERIITSPQGAEITVITGEKVLNFCANNYLGLANHPDIITAAKAAIDEWGYGLSSVRFICGTQDLHKKLEQDLSVFLGTEDTLLYAACFDANGGLFEPLLGEEDAIISDELNHASIIDGVRLCKARRLRYKHSSIDDLVRCLREASAARYRIVCTDGVFSMDGDIAPLPGIIEAAREHDALVMVDDSHATGYIGDTGKGTPEYWGVTGEIDLITTTFGKALGGASGGCTSGKKELIEMLRQRSRPYLFSNTLAPAVAGATRKALEILSRSGDLIRACKENAEYFRGKIQTAGFTIIPGETAIVPIMLKSENLALEMADLLLKEGIYVIGFAYPVVPRGKARIRVQLSAAHTRDHLDRAVGKFITIGKRLSVI